MSTRHLCALVCVLCCLAPLVAQASYQSCLKLYRAKKYIPAADCFQKLVRALDAKGDQGKAVAATKGTALRSAAIALNKAARQEARIEQAGYLRAQAIKLLERYDRDKLYPNALRQKSTLRLRLQMQTQLQMTPLSVLSGAADAALLVTGYRFQAKGKGKWLRSVRPGRYVIQVTYAGGKSKQKKISVEAGKALFATFQPPTKARPTLITPPKASSPFPAVGWTLLSIGALVGVGGVVSFGLMAGHNATISEKGAAFTSDCTASTSQACIEQGGALQQAYRDGQTMQSVGWVGSIAGGALVVTGLVMVLIPSTQAPALSSAVQPPSQPTSLSKLPKLLYATP